MDRAYYILAAILVIVFLGVPLGRRLLRSLRAGPEGHALTGLSWQLLRGYNRLIHRVRYEGLEHVPVTSDPGPLIVVSNHGAGVDPLLIQGACRFSIRWMMATDTMSPSLDWFWRWRRIIAVRRDGSDSAPLREAIRHLRGGGVLGVFPEGGLAPRDGAIRAFMPGIGFIVSRSKAQVLLVWVTDTPVCDSPFGALSRFSRSRVVFVDRITFPDGTSAESIVSELRDRLANASGWTLSDEPLPTARRMTSADSGNDADPFAA